MRADVALMYNSAAQLMRYDSPVQVVGAGADRTVSPVMCPGVRWRMEVRGGRGGLGGHLHTSTCVWRQSQTPQSAGRNQPA